MGGTFVGGREKQNHQVNKLDALRAAPFREWHIIPIAWVLRYHNLMRHQIHVLIWFNIILIPHVSNSYRHSPSIYRKQQYPSAVFKRLIYYLFLFQIRKTVSISCMIGFAIGKLIATVVSHIVIFLKICVLVIPDTLQMLHLLTV